MCRRSFPILCTALRSRWTQPCPKFGKGKVGMGDGEKLIRPSVRGETSRTVAVIRRDRKPRYLNIRPQNRRPETSILGLGYDPWIALCFSSVFLQPSTPPFNVSTFLFFGTPRSSEGFRWNEGSLEKPFLLSSSSTIAIGKIYVHGIFFFTSSKIYLSIKSVKLCLNYFIIMYMIFIE